MSTRSCIARLTGREPVTFVGVYHHWDGYPSGVGKRLWNLLHEGSADMKTWLKHLIDDHPAGWSTIIPGESNPGKAECYCHPARDREPEQGQVVTQENASDIGCEYVYAFDVEARTLVLLSSYCQTGDKMIGAFGCGDPDATWRPFAEIKIDEPTEPDWDALDEKGGGA